MSINLVKGQKIDLSKGTSGLSKIMVGLGWDPVEKNLEAYSVVRQQLQKLTVTHRRYC